MPTLRRGQSFRLAGLTYRVAYVTESRAHCIASVARVVTLRDRTFAAHEHRTLDISPQTDIASLSLIGHPFPLTGTTKE